MIQMPDIKLKTLLDAILDRIKNDYVDASDKTQTFLYKLYNGIEKGNYDFLENSIKIFNRQVDDPRTIDTRNFFDRERANLPTIHVTMPPEQPHGDGIGFDEGYVENTPVGDIGTATSMTEHYTRAYNKKFDLVITGSNTFEVTLISFTLKAALINNLESLEYNGFRNPKIFDSTGVLIMPDIQPPGYRRTISLDCWYELVVPKFDSVSIVNSIDFEGTAYDH
jgi:hypothetical protein